MAKWASRFALGLSTSVPGIRIEQDDIKIIEDISQYQHIWLFKLQSTTHLLQ
jgi:RNA-dependent RNA polymerase